ncbi:hypothetical protein GCM10025779_28590 [Arthrobacter cryoconiti]
MCLGTGRHRAHHGRGNSRLFLGDIRKRAHSLRHHRAGQLPLTGGRFPKLCKLGFDMVSNAPNDIGTPWD